MNLLGIIAEYNPFHNGHKWQIEQAKKISGCSYTIAVMSGHFTQRGEPAFFDKWKRAEMAVHGGIDLVIELPTIFATRSAQYFAQGGVKLLNMLQANYISFGAEDNDIHKLQDIATAIDHPDTVTALLTHLKSGCTYAKALEQALQNTCHVSVPVFTPNNILALEYLRSINQGNYPITPIIIKRYIAHYHDTNINAPIASARAIRESITHNKLDETARKALPESSVQIIHELLKNRCGPINVTAFSDIILALLRTATLQELANLPDMSEGLHYKLQAAALQSNDIEELLDKLKSKRYTKTHLQRLLIHVLLRNNAADVTTLCNIGPLYARVLAFNDNGRTILRMLQKQAEIPIITKTASFLNTDIRHRYQLTPLQKMLAIDTTASDLYCLGLPNKKLHHGGLDFTNTPIYVH